MTLSELNTKLPKYIELTQTGSDHYTVSYKWAWWWMPIGFIIVDSQGNITSFNASKVYQSKIVEDKELMTLIKDNDINLIFY